MESNIGFLEFELCKFFRNTPKQLGKLREEDPLGISFLELSMIKKWNQTAKEQEKREMESKRKAGGKTIRRK